MPVKKTSPGSLAVNTMGSSSSSSSTSAGLTAGSSPNTVASAAAAAAANPKSMINTTGRSNTRSQSTLERGASPGNLDCFLFCFLIFHPKSYILDKCPKCSFLECVNSNNYVLVNGRRLVAPRPPQPTHPLSNDFTKISNKAFCTQLDHMTQCWWCRSPF